MADHVAGGRRHLLLVGLVALTVYGLDQASKSWAVSHLADGHADDLVWTLRLKLTFNSGAAFSRGTGFGPYIAVLAIVIVGALVWTGRSSGSRLSAIAVGMVVGGALGNLSDRVLREGPGGFLGGSVVDFVDLQWWPVFNVADSAIVIGGILLIASAGFATPAADDDDEGDEGDEDDEDDDGEEADADETHPNGAAQPT